MSASVVGSDPCSDRKLHRREVSALEVELSLMWEWGLPPAPAWEVSATTRDKHWRDDDGVLRDAILQTFWHDMACGCCFGALQVRYSGRARVGVPLLDLGSPRRAS